MTQAKCQIREVSVAEMDAFRQIRLEALRCEPQAFASIYGDWLKLADAEWEARMNIPIFVAFVQDQPVALMALKRLELPKMMHRATLMMAYVNKSFRGSGLAGELLDAVIHHAQSKRIAQIELGVRADRKQAIRFYKNAGFAEIGNIPQGHEDAGGAFDEILMARRLNVGPCC